MKTEIIEFIQENKLIVSLKGFAPDTLLYTAEALIKGGITAIETEIVSTDEKEERESLQKIAALKKCFGKDILVGANKVISDRQVRLSKGAGADFITTPCASKEVIERAALLSVVSMPGAFTATEISNAAAFGADFINLFPAKLGKDFSNSALMVETFPELNFVASGNIDFNDIAALSKIGIRHFIIGGSLSNKVLAQKGEFAIITSEAKRYLDLIKTL